MPFEMYLIPNDPEQRINFRPLMPGQAMCTEAYQNEVVEAVALTCEKDDSAAGVYRMPLGNREENHEVNTSALTVEEHLKGQATHSKELSLRMVDDEDVSQTMVVRHAGKAALNPKFN